MEMLDNGIRVLAIENDPEDYLMIREYLGEEIDDPAIEQARTLAESKKFLNDSQSFDVILLDISLPDASGETAVKQLNELSGEVPVIVLTNCENRIFGREATGMGMADYLLKDVLNPFLLAKSIRYSLERNRANQSLSNSEARYSDLFDFSPLPMAIYDMDTLRFLDVNQQAIEKYGYSREEFLDLTIKDIRPEDKVEELERTLKESLNAEGLFKSGIHWHQKKNGELMRMDVRSQKITYNGRPVKLIVIHDVTEEKYYVELDRLERSILEKNARGRSDFKSLVKEFVLGVEKLYSGAKCSVMDIDNDRMYGFIAPNMPDEYIEDLDGVAIGENKGSCGTAAYTKNLIISENVFEDRRWKGIRNLADKYGFSACWSQPILDSRQEVIATFAIYFVKPQSPSEVDINTIRRVSQLISILYESHEKRKTERQLELSEQRFRSLVQDGSDMMGILDEEVNFKYVAPTAKRVLGISPEEFLGTNALDYIHEEDQQRIENILSELDEGERTEIAPFRFEDSEGNWRWLETVLTNMSDNPAVEGLVANSRDVTENIERKKKLQESLERYEYVTRATEEVIYDWDIENDILEWDDSFQNKFIDGVEKETYDIDYWAENVHPDDLAETKKSLYQALKDPSQSKWEQEYRFKKQDSSFATVFERGFIIRNAQDEAVRMIGSLQDITERKEYEQKLEKLSLVASKTTDLIIITDENDQIIWVNEAFEQLMGYQLEEVKGKSPGDILRGPETNSETVQGIAGAVANEESIQVVILNYSKNGDKYWLDMTMDPIFDEEGNCTGYIGVNKDVTEQIERQHELQESVERYDIVSKATSDTIWDLDLESNTMQYNHNIHSMFGYQKEEVKNLATWWRNKIHPEDRERIYKQIEEALNADADRFQMKYRFQSADGSYKYIYDRAFIVNDDEGRPIRMIGAMQDVTQQREERKWLQLFESAIANTKEAITISEGRPSDGPGRKILYVNHAFTEMTGFSTDEAVGETLNILNGPKTSEDERVKLSQSMDQWEACEAEFINYKKNGEEFWVHASMTPIHGPGDNHYWVC
ncbi:MAG TPA: PAS domain S-box protein, partial [Balneolaceae bacterium]|nr:PAS domain S-box protein [Balneolaceae bacterium]